MELQDATGSSLPHQTHEQIPSPISKIPYDIEDHRNRLFTLDSPVQFDEVAWNKYWPFVDNVWCLHNRQGAPESGVIEKFWGGCRLQRKWNHGNENPDGRRRVRRETGQCPAKFRLMVMPNGIRVLERNKEQHSHDLDYIDSIKRNSGIRSLVVDPFFSTWDAGPILAFLSDPSNYPSSVPNLFHDAGGRYLERREVTNILSQQFKKAYPGLELSMMKQQRDRYANVMTCRYKGCNMYFASCKELSSHRKSAHNGRIRDSSEKSYTCPKKDCHRYKRSKGFATYEALKEHQMRMHHWGAGIYFGHEAGRQYLQPVTEEDRLAAERERASLEADLAAMLREQSLPNGITDVADFPDFSDLTGVDRLLGDDEQNPLDLDLIDSNIQDFQYQEHSGIAEPTELQRQEMALRLETLELERARVDREMQDLRNAIYSA